VALALALTLAGPGPEAAPASPGGDTVQRSGECKVVSIRAPGSKSRKKKGFSARDVIDLEFRARVHAARGSEHRFQLKLYAPQGHLYQVLAAPFSLPGGRAGREPSGRVAVLTQKLPVAGTLITNNSLYGRWRVVPFLDAAPEACGPSRTFVIKP